MQRPSTRILAAIRVLLEAGADPNAGNERGGTAAKPGGHLRK